MKIKGLTGNFLRSIQRVMLWRLPVPAKYFYFPSYSGWVFAALFVIISLVYNFQDILFKPPQSIHQWRQCDCLSITLNYYQDNNPFFEPSIHFLGRDGTGKTASDFPLIYWLVAQLWKIFGHHEFIYRLFVLLFYFAGLLALFKLCENVLKDSALALSGALLLFASPTLVYYSNNFLMDIPAFSAALIGFWFFYRFSQNGRNIHFLLFLLFFALGGLLKISSLIGFFAVIGLFLLELMNVRMIPERKIFFSPVKHAAGFLLVLIIQWIWYSYASSYSAEHNPGVFLLGILPVWDLNKSQIGVVVEYVIDHIKWNYFARETQAIIVLFFLFVTAHYKKADRLFLALMLIIAVGMIAFLAIFFQPLKDHDYYTINLFVLIPVTWLGFVLLIKQAYNKLYAGFLFRALLVLLLLFNINFTRARIKGRYSAKGWQNQNYIENTRAFVTIGPYLNSIGINKDDKVISISDPSTNISLYLMNRKGWTELGVGRNPDVIKRVIGQGARYVFVYDKEVYDNEQLRFLFTNKVGEYENIEIFSISTDRKNLKNDQQ